jgi:HAMP domain-containing protein
MSMLLRANLIFGTSCLLIAAASGYLCRAVLVADAEREQMARAGLMLESALAIRNYTSTEIVPLLDQQLRTDFLPQSIPFYAATQNFLKLRERYPQYSYKEATLNPTNPRDRAADWEADIVQRFRNDDKVQELSGVRDTPMGLSLYMARPIRAEPECLACHSRPSEAPAPLIARYGTNNGFGWQAHEIVGAQVVSVPFAAAALNVDRSFAEVMVIIACALAILWLGINAVLYFLCLRPLKRIARIADTLSLGQTSTEEFPIRGPAEITDLGASFNRMRKSLDKALKLLQGQPP